MKGQYPALARPRGIRGDLLCTREIDLQMNLSDARAEPAREPTQLTANALAHVEQLMFFAEGDRC
jgi:hypothetical protein